MEKHNVNIDRVSFQIMVWSGPEEIAEGVETVIKANHVYQIIWTSIGAIPTNLN